jgi:hypothetical protein
MKLTHRFALLTPEKRPQDPHLNEGSALRNYGARRRVSRHDAASHQAD